MAYDSLRQRLVLFGGVGPFPTLYGDTWEWDGAAWSQRTPARSPPGARGYSVAAFDASRALIDTLKAEVPIWKHQQFADGSQEWVGTP